MKGGLIRAGYRTAAGAPYTITRKVGEKAIVRDGTGREVAVPVEHLVHAEFYSTHALQEIACDVSAQLDLLDRFVGEEMEEIRRTIDTTSRQLRETATKLLELSATETELKTEADLATGAEERLRAIQPQQGPDAAALQTEINAKGLREREREAHAAARVAVSAGQKAARDLAVRTKQQLAAVVDEALLSGRNGEAMRALSGHLRRVADAFETAAGEIGRACDLASADLAKDEKALDAVHEQQQQTYTRLLESNKDALAKEGERTAAQKQLAKALSARKTYEQRQSDRKQLEEHRRELLLQLSGLFDRRYELRKKVADSLTEMLAPNIRVLVSRAANNDFYQSVLEEGLANATREEAVRASAGLGRPEAKARGSNMRVSDVADKIVRKLTPQQLVAAVRRKDADWLSERVELDIDRARKVIARLEETEGLYELEMLEPVDVPSIELKDGEFKNIQYASTGQRGAVLLPIILLHGTHPIILDQPEEGLFARFKATTVARILREAKLRRQIIFVTHDANLVVLPIADRVNELASRDGKGYLKSSGTMPEQRETVADVLDGGDEAFLARMAFYGHKKKNDE